MKGVMFVKKVKLLDCTLRDGGYLIDWNFKHENIVSIFERVVDAGTDIIEIGFIDDRRTFDINRSIMPDTKSVEKIFEGLDGKNTSVFGMIDYGTCDLSNIQPCAQSVLDGLRVIFKKHLRREAMEYIGELKKLGYIVCAQLVSVTSYTDEEMVDLINIANEINPDYVSMVDTYGLMHQNNLMHYFELLNENLNSNIAIGYHGHNNFQMGYANCIAMLSFDTEREILVDGTLYGMGKSAGNAPIELIAMHMNHAYGKNYKISQYLEAIDSNILQFTENSTWGYNIFYFLAASNMCHPNYVQDLMNKRSLSVKQINDLLGMLEGDKRTLYDKQYMEDIYVEYQNKKIDDNIAISNLRTIFCEDSPLNILVIGPGESAYSSSDEIKKQMEQTGTITISINYFPEDIPVDMVFISNAKRYVQMASALSKRTVTTISTSNVTCMNGEFDYVLDISKLLDIDADIIDNSLVMFIKALIRIGVKRVELAGFDGYFSDRKNYFNASMEYDFAKEKAEYLNNYTRTFLAEVKGQIEVKFLTESKYNEN